MSVIIILLYNDIVFSDIDECELDRDLCDQICENTDGSYFCTCMDGYQLVEDSQCQGL